MRILQTKARTIDALRGTSNRYTVTRRAGTVSDKDVYALFKAVGGHAQRQHANVSGWRTRSEMDAYLDGLIEGLDTHARSAAA